VALKALKSKLAQLQRAQLASYLITTLALMLCLPLARAQTVPTVKPTYSYAVERFDFESKRTFSSPADALVDYAVATGRNARNVRPWGNLTTNGQPGFWAWDELASDGQSSERGFIWLYVICPTVNGTPWVAQTTPPTGSGTDSTAYCVPGPLANYRICKGTQDGTCTPQPIWLSTGDKYRYETDYVDHGTHPLTFTRSYLSSGRFNANMGPVWSHNHAAVLASIPALTIAGQTTNPQAVLEFDIHQKTTFNKVPDAGGVLGWQGASGYGSLTQTASAFAYRTNDDDRTYTFATNGQLQSITERNGWVMSYTYGSAGKITQIRNQFGRTLQFAYSNELLTAVTTPDGRTIRYTYDVQKRLQQVTYPDGTTRSFFYENASFYKALTGIAVNGTRIATYAYDVVGRATATEQAGGVDRYQVSYQALGAGSPVTVTDPLGTQRSYTYGIQNGQTVTTSGTQPAALGMLDAKDRAQNTRGLVTGERDFRDVITTTVWDDKRQLSLSITQGSSNALNATPVSAVVVRTRTFTWHAKWALPLTVTESGRTTTYSYDTKGNRTSETITDTTTTPNNSRTTRWTYNSAGLVATQTASNGAVSTYAYDSVGNLTTSTNALGHTSTYQYDSAGRITRATSPTGLVTTNTYDSRGRLLTINSGGLVTTNTYTTSGQLSNVQLPSGQRITYTYDGADRLTGWSDNRGATASYQLDGMGNRVREEIRDTRGQHWLFARSINSLNRPSSTTAGGYLTTYYSYDSNGELTKTNNAKNEGTTLGLDTLRRVNSVTDAHNATARLTRNAQDAITSATDNKGVATQYTRDALGNATLEATLDSGNERATFDALGLPTRTIDALGKATTIARDTLGRPTLITHPDATTTALAYDQTGTDYNAPNQPNASNGTLSRITDPSGTTTYQRDQFGRITRTTQQLKVLGEGATLTLATSYNAAGQIATITYPGAGKLTHLYNSTGQLTGLNWNDLPLLTGIIYNPLGQPTSWAWQYADTNAVTQTATTRRYNSAGQLTQSANAAYTWDRAGRITAINENLLVPASAAQGDTSTTTLTVPWRAQYDALGRITQWSSAGKTATIAATGTTPAINATYYPATTNYSYDANGNPTATNATSTTGQGAWSQTKQYTTNATTNRLLGVATTTAQGSAAPTTATIASTYNGAGDPITDGVRNYTYDSQRRIDSISLLGANPAKTYYAHNILGQRIFKTEALFGVPTANAKKLGWAYVYDASGTLMGEYGMGGSASSGSTQHIYLPTAAGSLPVAAVINGQHYAVHADHLNTPRRLTGSNNQVVWQWAFSAFGQEPPTTPDKRFTNASTKPSTGTTTAAAVTYNLRYPGQVYDAESKLHYNYHRTYDPQTGRYTQPDPIGLDGGWNRYSYVEGNPLSYTDPMGLYLQSTWQTIFGGKTPNISLPNPVGAAGQAAGAVGDFGGGYRDMMDATYGVGGSHNGWANQDKYFHCRANCEAAQRGRAGQCTATSISDAREWFDQTIKGDPASASAADQAANAYGRQQGAANPGGSCKQLCGIYRPGGSFPAGF
jgi:RHS repeat-associated protein